MRGYLLLIAGWGVLSMGALAQTESSAFTITGHGVATPFATDYHTLGINPANLDMAPRYEGKYYALGLMEFAGSFYSEALKKSELRQNLLGGDIADMSRQEQEQTAIEFANSTNSADLDVMSLGFAVQTNKLGGFAFSSRERIDFFSKMGSQTSELLWLGYNAPYFENLILSNGDTIPNDPNLSEDTLAQVIKGITALQNASSISDLLDGTQFRFSYIREFNLGYGKRLLSRDTWQLLGGIGIKFLVGQGIMEINASGGNAQVFTALSPLFNINYDDIDGDNPSQLPESASTFSPVGFGIGVDLGATMVIKEKFVISAAVTDIGKMTWDGNLYELNDFELTEFENSGLESVSFLDQVNQLSGGDGLLDWKGATSRTTKLPSTMRGGFGLMLPKLRAGIDIVAPLNDEVGNLDKASIAIGGEFVPIPWFRLSAGVIQGGNYDTKIPAGICFVVGKGTYEIGVASRDMVTFFTNKQPTVSASVGFMRFRF